MYEGYLSFGCTEIANASRAYWYSVTSDCPVEWLRLTYCDNIATALGEDPYVASNIPIEAPWYDPYSPELADFYGVYPTKIENLTDSQRTATITEGILDGGTISGYRHTTRSVRVEAILIARGQDALEAGFSWLDAALEPDTCGVHGSSCGEVDLQFFNSCPPLPEEDETPEHYEERVSRYVRILHGVTAISGPTVIQKLRRDGPGGGVLAYIVEFVLAAATPFVFSEPKEVFDSDVTPTIPVAFQDIPYNLIPYPSAEIPSATTVVVAQNLSTNPSVETDLTGWSTVADGTAILIANVAALTRSLELSANGSYSAKTIWTAPGAGAVAGWFAIQQTVALPAAAVAGDRYSINLWASGAINAGAPVLGALEIRAYWQNAASTTLREDLLGTVGTAGGTGAVSKKSIAPPVGATKVVVRALQRVTSWPAGAGVKLYADALAVTVP